jgi:hypothetical protein
VNGQAAVSGDIRWLADILWSRDPAVTVSLRGQAPSGTSPKEVYAVLPSADRPRFFLPLESRRAGRAALASYRALRPPATRLARAALAAGVGVGVTEKVFRDRLIVSVVDDQPPSQLPSLLLREHLREALQDRHLVVAIGMRPPGPYAKPVLQAFSTDGQPRGFVKIGWNATTKGLVRTEAGFLRARAERPFRTIVVPALLHRAGWRDLDITVASPLPLDVRRLRRPTRLPPLDATREIAEAPGLRRASLGRSSYWTGLRGSLEAMIADDPMVHDTMLGHLARVEERYGEEKLLFGGWHGDWTPWNVARHQGRIVAWDWEQAGDDVPLGFDVMHYLFQRPFAGNQLSLEEAVAICRRRSGAPLRALGVPSRAQPAVRSAYLLELFRRYYAAQRAGAGLNTRFYPAILELLTTDQAD